MLVVKNSPANSGDIKDVALIPGSGRSPGVGNGNPFQYSCLENPIYREAWQATVLSIAQNQTGLKQLSMYALQFFIYVLISSAHFPITCGHPSHYELLYTPKDIKIHGMEHKSRKLIFKNQSDPIMCCCHFYFNLIPIPASSIPLGYL